MSDTASASSHFPQGVLPDDLPTPERQLGTVLRRGQGLVDGGATQTVSLAILHKTHDQ